jgi:hypothetical protein
VSSARALALLAKASLWRATRVRALGASLVDALGDRDETVRAVAGIVLARAGPAAVPLLCEALAARRQVAPVLTLLGDVGGAGLDEVVAPFASDTDPDVARAARDALRVLAVRAGRRRDTSA